MSVRMQGGGLRAEPRSELLRAQVSMKDVHPHTGAHPRLSMESGLGAQLLATEALRHCGTDRPDSGLQT